MSTPRMYAHEVQSAALVFPEIAEVERAMVAVGMPCPTTVWFPPAVEKVYRRYHRTRLVVERQLRIRDRRAKRRAR